jgi:hypothetical protein
MMCTYLIEICIKELKMAKCVNCERDGGYLVENPGAMPQVYCDKDLPSFFNKANLPAHIKEIPLNHLHDTDEEEMKHKAMPKKQRVKNKAADEEVSTPAVDALSKDATLTALLEEHVSETAEWI